MANETVDVDPRTLHLPPARRVGADFLKLARQISQFGDSTDGMPPIWCCRTSDGELIIYNGVTRATRVAKLAPGKLITVEVIDELAYAVGDLPTIGELLP